MIKLEAVKGSVPEEILNERDMVLERLVNMKCNKLRCTKRQFRIVFDKIGASCFSRDRRPSK